MFKNIHTLALIGCITLMCVACQENPGKCEYTSSTGEDRPMSSGCVSFDESVFDATSCRDYAEEKAQERGWTVLESKFTPDEEC